MYEIIKKNLDKNRYLLFSGLLIMLLLLLTVVYKSDEKIVKKSEILNNTYVNEDLFNIKKFLLNQIKSPFTNLNYEIKKGDTIQKILKKYKARNNEIQTVINKYKKYGNPNKLLVGNKIDIILRKSTTTNNNLIVKFSVPITKSTTIAITRDEEARLKYLDTSLANKKAPVRLTAIVSFHRSTG